MPKGDKFEYSWPSQSEELPQAKEDSPIGGCRPLEIDWRNQKLQLMICDRLTTEHIIEQLFDPPKKHQDRLKPN